jgi:SAM-dependent methyltransferase
LIDNIDAKWQSQEGDTKRICSPQTANCFFMRRTIKGQNLNLEAKETLIQVADKLVASTVQLMRTAKTEEDLRIRFEKILEPLCLSIGVESHAKYEKSIYKSGRVDALHGQVIIEYERPGAFQSPKRVNHACDQLIDYIKGEAKERKETLFLLDPKLVGVGFDGEQIFFVHYQGDKTKLKTRLDKRDFKLIGPYFFNAQSARTFLTYLRALSRILLTAENLDEAFGSQSKLAAQVVSAFADALENWDSKSRARTFFNEWRRLFGIVYGEQFNTQQAEEVKKLSELYKVGKETDFQELLFSVHTYFVFLMKLIAAELLTISETSFKSAFSDDLVHANKKTLLHKLNYIEEGGVYAQRGITNFLEGDFFRWYLDAFSPRVEEAIREVARALSDFEPATTVINPKSNRDLLKKLYQYLVPQEVRHKLGEYYTPDWLAELLLNEVDYDGNTFKRFLDPACGSGTFLVLAIQRAKEYGHSHKEAPLETAKRIVANIWGFDLNPLAVIASRTNYLFALGELVDELPDLEIPIYLADSVLWPNKAGQMQINFAGGEHIKVQTSVGQFHVPHIWVKDEGFLMRKAAPIVEKMAKQNYLTSEAIKCFKKEGLVFPPHELVVKNFYGEILELEEQGKNGIWARFLKNAFAPMIAGKFDFVVGNPPWIRWGYLSKEYRKATFIMWQGYGLFSLKGIDAWLGGSEKDFSMLFTYAVADHYLNDHAKLAFLITQEVFKSKGAGEGFRRFQLGDQESLKVVKTLDLVSVQPFEGAANKTAAIILKKGTKTTYPVPYTLWKRKKGVGKIPTDMIFEEAMRLLKKGRLFAQPIGSHVGSWQTLEPGQKALANIQGENCYKARLGARVEPYGVFWLDIIQVLSDGNLVVRNRSKRGKRKVQQVEESIEPDLVFPAICGADIHRWGVVSNLFILITENIQEGRSYSEAEMKLHFPRTYSYLTHFKETLLDRASHLIVSLLKRNAFFVMSGMLPHVFTRYKVVWKRMANDLIAAVVSTLRTPLGYKVVIPTDTTSLFATENEGEAHYLCAVMNSKLVREFIKSYSSAGRGFGTPSVMNHVGIPKFNPKNKLHQKLAQLSKTLHDFKAEDKLDEVARLEREVDRSVYKLFGITREIS